MENKKGKQPTKGAKQIVEENAATVHFYRNMALGAGSTYGLVTFLFYYDFLYASFIFLNVIAIGLYLFCCQFLKHMSTPKYSESGQLLDSGVDLNMEGGIAEHLKDIVILTSVTHVLALVSNYFWLLLLLLPTRAFWLLWVNILSPWFFQAPPQDVEQDEKKKKKMERKMKRYQQ